MGKLSDLISPEALRDLYEVQLISENEIARRLDTHQVYIGRLRRRYGIPTITQAQRSAQRLPSLTVRQEDVLLGSLLGDGSLQATSGASARFSEGHSLAQRAYAEWKADELAPFVSRRFDRVKKDKQTGKGYPHRSFYTVSCPQFRFWYDLFYPGPARKRVFPVDMYKRLTPLALAIWYMDDGSLVKPHLARISFGLDPVSLSRARKALRRMGLEPRVYGTGGNVGLWFSGQSVTFLRLVDPHVPECMRYKLPQLTELVLQGHNAKALTPERADQLAAGGLTTREIAEAYKIGISTAQRRLKGSPRRKPGPKGRLSPVAAEGLLIAKYPCTKSWVTETPEVQVEQIDEVLGILRRTRFPFPEIEPVGVRQRHWDRLVALDGGEITMVTSGIRLCYPFFPSRYRAAYRGQIAAYEAWHNSKHLRQAIRWQFKVGDPVTPRRVVRAVTANCRTPTVFRPGVARALYGRYCHPGGVVWDPCSGFGGRLIGAVASGLRYIATDVSPDVIKGNQELAKWLGVGDQVEMHLTPAEDFTPPTVDMVFTSPPYFRQEEYIGGTQSWQVFPDFNSWVEGFLRPMVQRGASALTPGGHWVMNIADVRSGGVALPLVAEARKAFEAAGLKEVANLEMPISRLNRSGVTGEPVLVWQKPAKH